jgi:release factor glutamine methyltransferase
MTGSGSPAVAFDPATSIIVARQMLTAAFQAAGCASPEIDARFLLQGVLGITAADLLRDPDRKLGEGAQLLTECVRRRLTGEPVSRILGQREFYGRTFMITPDVLDPRPESETLVEVAIEIVAAHSWRDQPIRIADVGTGSGILIVSLLAELPLATGIASDVSPAALGVAKLNAERLGVGGRVTFVATPGIGHLGGNADLIVSNPPYIPAANIASLTRDVRDFDPVLALDGGPDGLDIYRDFANDFKKFDRPALIALEIGAGQAADVETIFAEAGARMTGQKADLGGHIRVVVFERRC